jgi:hypothetical protein
LLDFVLTDVRKFSLISLLSSHISQQGPALLDRHGRSVPSALYVAIALSSCKISIKHLLFSLKFPWIPSATVDGFDKMRIRFNRDKYMPFRYAKQ